MNNKRIEQGIADAIKTQTPDMLDEILLEYSQAMTNGRNIDMNTNADIIKNEQENRDDKVIDITSKVGKSTTKENIVPKRRLASLIVSVAAIAALAFVGLFSYNNIMIDYTIGIDVNPSIEMNVNRKEDIIKITPLNDEGITILDGMDLKGVDLDIAVNALVGSMLKHGYVDDAKNSILVTVENTDLQKGGEVQKRIAAEIESTLKNYSVAGAIMSQTVSSTNDVKTIANQYGISIGKANLINQLVKEDPTLKFEKLAGLSINDLNLISETRTPNIKSISSSGTASSNSYIGEDKAKEIAFKHAGLTKVDLKASNVKMDFDDGIMVYELDFYTAKAEYEYDINAKTGAIVSNDVEFYKVNDTTTTKESKGNITLEAAKKIALDHAGFTESQVTFIKAKSDFDDGHEEYEIEFYKDNVEYDYDIDAKTGKIISYDHDAENYTIPSTPIVPPATTPPTTKPPSTTTPETTSPNTNSGITLEEAKKIALNHAGLASSQVSFVKSSKEWDDGRWEYEIEFYSGNVEYDYDIDATTGKILSFDSDAEYYDMPVNNNGENAETAASNSKISAEEAKQIAFKHAGVSSSNVHDLEVDDDYENGTYIYEIDFKSGNIEYEYDINGSTGAIIKSSKEQDD